MSFYYINRRQLQSYTWAHRCVHALRECLAKKALGTCSTVCEQQRLQRCWRSWSVGITLLMFIRHQPGTWLSPEIPDPQWQNLVFLLKTYWSHLSKICHATRRLSWKEIPKNCNSSAVGQFRKQGFPSKSGISWNLWINHRTFQHWNSPSASMRLCTLNFRIVPIYFAKSGP